MRAWSKLPESFFSKPPLINCQKAHSGILREKGQGLGNLSFFLSDWCGGKTCPNGWTLIRPGYPRRSSDSMKYWIATETSLGSDGIESEPSMRSSSDIPRMLPLQSHLQKGETLTAARLSDLPRE